jgi:hypothetical protein
MVSGLRSLHDDKCKKRESLKAKERRESLIARAQGKKGPLRVGERTTSDGSLAGKGTRARRKIWMRNPHLAKGTGEKAAYVSEQENASSKKI